MIVLPNSTVSRPYQICTRCVMDTSDPEISFDSAGVCSHCRSFDQTVALAWHPADQTDQALTALAERIRESGKDKEYDCIIGLSGGVDSSYLAYVAVEKMKLRPLAVHIDAGWNNDHAVRNIAQMVKRLNIDLFTIVIDWSEMRDLQLAFLKSGVENQDTPQDHAFFAGLFSFASKRGIKWVLSGYNYASESILPRSWGYNYRDTRQIRAIHRRFGSGRLRTFPLAGLFSHYIFWPRIRRMRVVAPLNLMPYDKEQAKAFLMREFDWRDYGGKHHESRFTKFFQAWWLPTKFGFDKRRAHLSSLILAGQIGRADALSELEKPAYPPGELREDVDFIRKKLGITETDFQALMDAPPRSYRDYPSWARVRGWLHQYRRWRRGVQDARA